MGDGMMGYFQIGYGHIMFTEECIKCGRNQHQHKINLICLNWDTWKWICSDCEKKEFVYFLPHEIHFLCEGIN
jgi:hypothetical protein